MKVILTEPVPSLGRTGDMVKVKDGYGRNYLLPRKFAVIANEKNVKELQHQQRLLEQKKQTELQEAQSLSAKLESSEITIKRLSGEQDKLFGSVTSMDIVTALQEVGHEVDRRQVILKDPIKSLGYYTIPVRVAHGIEANLKLWVVAEKDAGGDTEKASEPASAEVADETTEQ